MTPSLRDRIAQSPSTRLPAEPEAIASRVTRLVTQAAVDRVMSGASEGSIIASSLAASDLSGIHAERVVANGLADVVCLSCMSPAVIDVLGLGSNDGLSRFTTLISTAASHPNGSQRILELFLLNESDVEESERAHRLVQIFQDPSQKGAQATAAADLFRRVSESPQAAYRVARTFGSWGLVPELTSPHQGISDSFDSLSTEELAELFIHLMTLSGQTDIPSRGDLIQLLQSSPEARQKMQGLCADLFIRFAAHGPSVAAVSASQAGGNAWRGRRSTDALDAIEAALAEIKGKVSEEAEEESKVMFSLMPINEGQEEKPTELYTPPAEVKEETEEAKPVPVAEEIRAPQSTLIIEKQKVDVDRNAALINEMRRYLATDNTQIEIASLVVELKGQMEILGALLGDARRIEDAEQKTRSQREEEARIHEIIVVKTEEAARTTVALMPCLMNSPVISALLQRHFRDTTFPIVETYWRILERLGISIPPPPDCSAFMPSGYRNQDLASGEAVGVGAGAEAAGSSPAKAL